MAAPVFDRCFYQQNPEKVARLLLGQLLVSTIGGKKAAGIIVETEAYLAKGDSAAHGFKGKNNKNSSMFGPAGNAYVYPIHARYCFNTVTQSPDLPSAVLIRAIQPVSGIRQMSVRRSTDDLLNLCSGPAKLCQALGIDASANGMDLTTRRKIWIEQSAGTVKKFKRTIRIGVTSAHDAQLRFVIAANEFASGPKYLR